MTQLMGIVNVTPDSFSDGGDFLAPERAIAHGLRLVEEGADVLDIGGESTRPGAAAVDAEEEIRRVVPVIEGLMEAGCTAQISIDTSKAAVADQALGAGATIVNDVTALGDERMAAACARGEASLILMHMKGTPRTMQENPVYEDVVAEVRDYLAGALEHAIREGVPEGVIWLDPGIGFGKTVEHNLELIDRLGELRSLGRPIVLGASRKRFIGTITGREVGDRVGGTLAANVIGMARGAEMLRVHDVREAREALVVAEAILGRRDWREPEGVVAR
jgi:dihydropteroate synthase